MTEWQRAYIDTLLTTDIKQTQGRLCKVDNRGNYCYCALGLAAEVARQNGERVEYDMETEYSSVLIKYKGCGSGLVLPNTLIRLLGLRSDCGSPTVDIHSKHPTLPSIVKMNDDLGWSFKKIGQYLQTHHERYFV